MDTVLSTLKSIVSAVIVFAALTTLGYQGCYRNYDYHIELNSNYTVTVTTSQGDTTLQDLDQLQQFIELDNL